MKTESRTIEVRDHLKSSTVSCNGQSKEGNEHQAGGSTRGEFLQRIGVMGGVAAAANLNRTSGIAYAAHIPPTHSSVSAPKVEIKDYSNIPQRTHKYSASERAKQMVQESITMDSLFFGVWPSQWSSPEAPEFHDEMARCKAAGFKALENGYTEEDCSKFLGGNLYRAMN